MTMPNIETTVNATYAESKAQGLIGPMADELNRLENITLRLAEATSALRERTTMVRRPSSNVLAESVPQEPETGSPLTERIRITVNELTRIEVLLRETTGEFDVPVVS